MEDHHSFWIQQLLETHLLFQVLHHQGLNFDLCSGQGVELVLRSQMTATKKKDEGVSEVNF